MQLNYKKLFFRDNLKGAKNIRSISKERLKLLNNGVEPTKNLVEFLGTDMCYLLNKVLADTFQIKMSKEEIKELKNLTIVKRMEYCGKYLLDTFLKKSKNDLASREIFYNKLCSYNSDIVRGWACYSLSYEDNQIWNLKDKFEILKPIANDGHFGVQEVAWASFRKYLISNIDDVLKIMEEFSKDNNPNIRRFASEITRPIGVWCPHSRDLKKNPQLGRKILENLKQDSSRYVQLSVGNWLNDASKNNPNWVLNLVKSWGNTNKNTIFIINRGLRTLKKRSL